MSSIIIGSFTPVLSSGGSGGGSSSVPHKKSFVIGVSDMMPGDSSYVLNANIIQYSLSVVLDGVYINEQITSNDPDLNYTVTYGATTTITFWQSGVLKPLDSGTVVLTYSTAT